MAVSRSLGDRDFKAVTRGKDIISGTPEVCKLRLDSSHNFLVLMSDGVTDVMANEEIVHKLACHVGLDSKPDTHGACKALVQEVLQRGSSDNVTVVLAILDWQESVEVADAEVLS